MMTRFLGKFCLVIGLIAMWGIADDFKSVQAQAYPVNSEVGEIFGLDNGQMMHIDLDRTPGQRVRAAIQIDGQRYQLDLQPYSIRTDGFVLQEQLADGSYLNREPGPSRTVKGSLVGVPGSRVVGSVLESGLAARIEMGDGTACYVEPLNSRLNLEQADNIHVLYTSADVKPNPSVCGINQDTLRRYAKIAASEANEDGEEGGGNGAGPTEGGSMLSIAQLALDADSEFHATHGSVEGALDRMELVISLVNQQFESQVSISHRISWAIVRSSGSDPYTSTNYSTLLSDQFMPHWEINQSHVPRDVAHLFTGKEIDGPVIGLAYVGEICTSFSYGFSQSDYNGNLACATDLTAHEFGHNWNANHCDCPANTMNAIAGNCSNSFSTETINTIVAFRDDLPCLSDPPEPAQRVVLFDNGVNENNLSEFTFSDVEFSILAADDVQLAQTTSISMIGWSGIYSAGFAPPLGVEYEVRIYSDNNGLPSAEPLATFNVGDANQTMGGNNIYTFSAAIDFTMQASTTYWISVVETSFSQFPPGNAFRWSAIDGAGNSAQGPNWVSANDALALTLFVDRPEIDNTITPAGYGTTESVLDYVSLDDFLFYEVDYDGVAGLRFDSSGSSADMSLALFDEIGGLIAANEIELHLDSLSAGTYFLAIAKGGTSFGTGFNVAISGNTSGGANTVLDVSTTGPSNHDVVGTFTPNGVDFCDTDFQTLNNNSPYFYEVVYDGQFPLLFETFGSPNDIDTEIALFDVNGNLITENDDVLGNGSQLVFSFNSLSAGTYFLAVAGSDSDFADEFTVNQLSQDFTPGPVTVKVATRQAVPVVSGTFSPMGYQFSDSDTVMLDPDGYVIYDLFYDGVAPLTIDTLASTDDVDTEIALYGTGSGRPVIAENDDAEGGSQSRLFFDSLPAGSYNIVVSGHETQFFNELFIYNVFTDFTPGLVTLSVTTDPMFILGDVNCDGAVNLLDIGPFVDLISSGTFDPKADLDQNGEVNLLDVGPFVALLSGN